MLIKRLFDIIISFIGLIILSPIFLIITILIKLFMSGPVLFRQKRIGRYGKPFMITKFRTMVIDHSGKTVSIKGEDRITSLGRYLRKCKLDELLELWNVLKGDMSFVGPRPDVPEYYDMLVGEERLILELRPGITSPASLKYSNEEELLASVPDPQKYNDEILWPDKVKLNMEYYYNRSFVGDVCLILKTIFGRDKNTLV
jgi:lipopolysaccharide/colanic/teichoic acid biosynthesis glycosyltransferase